jgi:hypothetical protein
MCIKLGFIHLRTMMHGQQNTTFIITVSSRWCVVGQLIPDARSGKCIVMNQSVHKYRAPGRPSD